MTNEGTIELKESQYKELMQAVKNLIRINHKCDETGENDPVLDAIAELETVYEGMKK